MPIYHKLGNFPKKRHTQFEKPDGGLYYEQLFGTVGFDGMSTNSYHEQRPTQVKEIRKQVGAYFPIAIKLNSADFQKGGFTEEDSLATIKALSKAGIDLIEISGGTYESGVAKAPQKASTIAREAFFIDFAEKVRAQVKTPLMVTGGFRSVEGMNQALGSDAFDVVGIARLMAIDPDAPKYLLAGTNSEQTVQPIKTGIKKIDQLGVMEVLWYTQQLNRIAKGSNPKPKESGLWAFIKSVLRSGWGTYKTQRTRIK